MPPLVTISLMTQPSAVVLHRCSCLTNRTIYDFESLFSRCSPECTETTAHIWQTHSAQSERDGAHITNS